MKLMLTSFGLGVSRKGEVLGYNPMKGPHVGPNAYGLFKGMPPVSMRSIMGPFFLPDYAVLLIADRVILDRTTFSFLCRQPTRAYALVASAFPDLEAEGFIELADYATILEDNRQLLDRMLESDLESLERWRAPLRESIGIWSSFIKKAESLPKQTESVPSAAVLHDVRHFVNASAEGLDELNAHWLGAHYDTQRNDGVLRDLLPSYLAYVNANLILANELGVGFHDWADYAPFYRTKFLTIGSKDFHRRQASADAVSALFEVSFPDFAIHDAKAFTSIVKDNRIASLRAKIQAAVDGSVRFDRDFALNTVLEVLNIERRTAHYRHVTFFLTLPLHFIPIVGSAVHKIVEEVANNVIQRKLQLPYRWFYLLSDVSERTGSQTHH